MQHVMTSMLVNDTAAAHQVRHNIWGPNTPQVGKERARTMIWILSQEKMSLSQIMNISQSQKA